MRIAVSWKVDVKTPREDFIPNSFSTPNASNESEKSPTMHKKITEY